MDAHVRVLYSPSYSDHPPSFLQAFLELMSPTEVFACENGTLFFHQDENFFLAVGEMICFLCLVCSCLQTCMLTFSQFF